jgi:uncharacterized protein with HEPN domain
MTARDENLYLLHILDAIGQIGKYLDGLNYEEFSNSRLVQDAVISPVRNNR